MSCLVGLSLTTPASELIPWLRRVGVPQAVLEIALLMYRLLFILAARAMAGRQAQEARLGYMSFGRSVRSLGLLTAALLSRSLARARRLEIGLAARGFQGELKVLSKPRALSAMRLTTAGVTLVAVGIGGLTLSRVLQRHPVGGGVTRRLAALDGARHLDRPAEQQELFRQRGLAGVGMGDDCEGPAFAKWVE